jgi:hypothetical protein
MAIEGAWVTFLTPKIVFDNVPILCHFSPIYAMFMPLHAILRHQHCSNQSILLNYTNWEPVKLGD